MNIKVSYFNKDIARVIINEPKTYNSLSTKNLNDLITVFKKLDKNQKIKVIIIEGAGKGYSAGHNLKEVRALKKKRKISKIIQPLLKVNASNCGRKKTSNSKSTWSSICCWMSAGCKL